MARERTFLDEMLLADVLLEFGRLTEVEELLDRTKTEVKTLEESSQWLYRYARLLLKQGDYQKTTITLSTGLREARELGDDLTVVRMKLLLQELHWRQGELASAVGVLQSLNNLLSRTKETFLKAELRYQEGIVYRQQGELEKAKECTHKSLTLFRELSNKQGEAKALSGLAIIYWTQGLLEEALNHYKKAHALYELINSPQSLGVSFNNIANVYLTQGRLQHALDYFLKGKEQFHILGNAFLEAYATNNIGLLYYNQGLCNDSLREYEQALAIFREVGNPQTLAACLNNIGLVHRSLGDYEQAQSYLRESLEHYRSVGNPQYIADTLFDLARLAVERGDFSEQSDVFEYFPNPPYENPITYTYRTMLDGLLAYQLQNWERVVELLESALTTTGLDYEHHVYLYELLAEASLAMWRKSSNVDSLKVLQRRFAQYEAHCVSNNLSGHLCKLYLLRARFYWSLLQLDTAKHQLDQCVHVAIEKGLPTHLKLAQTELEKFRGMEEITSAHGRPVPNPITLEDFGHYLKNINRLIAEEEKKEK